MELSDSMLFNNTELFCSVHIFICSYDSKGNHSLVSGKMSNEERKAILHVRKIPPQSKYSFAQPSVIQQNTTSIKRVLAGTRFSIKAFICYSHPWSSQREFFISSGKGRSISAQWNVNSTFFYECPQALKGNSMNTVVFAASFHNPKTSWGPKLASRHKAKGKKI